MTSLAIGRQPQTRQRATRIAIDLLGGDHAPAVVVDGALEALDADPDLRLLLVGPPRVAESVVVPPSLRARLEVATARSVPPTAPRVSARGDAAPHGADESPVRTAMRAVVSGAADAVVSAGPTGGTVTAAVREAGRLPGSSPALAVILPASAGPVVLLDVGAVPDRGVRLLVSHAALGASYAATLLNLVAPRVGLLSIGEESDKGDRLLHQAQQRLSRAQLPERAHFVGNVEGHHVPLGGPADVVVTDGFTGNVLLKAVEGAIALVGGDIPRSSAPRAALLLGVAATVVVCHGAAAAADLASGVALAARAARLGVTDRIAAACLATGEVTAGPVDEEVRR